MNPVTRDTLRLSISFGIGYVDNSNRASDILIEEAQKTPEDSHLSYTRCTDERKFTFRATYSINFPAKLEIHTDGHT